MSDVDTGHEQDVALEHRAGVEEPEHERLVDHHGGRHGAVDDRAEEAVHAPTQVEVAEGPETFFGGRGRK